MSIGPVLVIGMVILGIIGLLRRATGRRSGRRGGGVGPGAAGAIYDLLNEDKRNAIEIIVEQKAEATDPETADDVVKPPRNP